MEINIKNREFLQKMREMARIESLVDGLNPHWQRVYQRLEDALNELDAFIARTKIKK